MDKRRSSRCSIVLVLALAFTKDQQEMLVKENGEWKIGVPKTQGRARLR